MLHIASNVAHHRWGWGLMCDIDVHVHGLGELGSRAPGAADCTTSTRVVAAVAAHALALRYPCPRGGAQTVPVCAHDLCTISSLHTISAQSTQSTFAHLSLLIFLFTTTLCGTAPVLAFRAKSYL